MSLPIVPILSEDLQAPPLQQLGHGRNQAPPDWEALKHQFRGRNDALGARRRTSHSNEPDDSLETNRSPPPIRHVISEYSWPLILQSEMTLGTSPSLQWFRLRAFNAARKFGPWSGN